MNRPLSLLALSGLALLVACQRGGDPAAASAAAPGNAAALETSAIPANADVVAAAPVPSAAPAPSGLERLRGDALMGKDGYGITLCGESMQRIVALDPAPRALVDQYLANGAREFFIDGWGRRAANGQAKIKRIERIYSEGHGCEEPSNPAQVQARGTEPFWAASIEDGRLRLQRPDEADRMVDVEASTSLDGERLFQSTSAGAVSLTLAPGSCSDGMSDTLYAWKATLQVGEEFLAGCGYAGLGATEANGE